MKYPKLSFTSSDDSEASAHSSPSSRDELDGGAMIKPDKCRVQKKLDLHEKEVTKKHAEDSSNFTK